VSPRILKRASSIASLVLSLLIVAPAYAIDWSKVSGKDIVLFYPAQLSWEMLLTQSEHSGAKKFREGKDCRGCHEGEEQASGRLLVADKNSERAPIAGKPGFLKVLVKAAHDGDRLYVHLEFDTVKQPNAGLDKEFATKVAVMLDDGHVTEATRAGCWAACHDNLARMPSGGEGDTTKYLTRSRVSVARSGGDQIKPAEELAKIRAEGGYLEYWQARLNPGAMPQAVDGTVLEKRQENAAPVVSVTATEANGLWSVTLSRKLAAGIPYKDIAAGRTYTVGFSIHAGHTARRFHYVSLEKTLVLDKGPADFIAIRQ